MLFDYAFARARVTATRILGTAKAVMTNLEGLLDDTSTDEPIFGVVGVVSRPKSNVNAKDASGLNPQGETEVLCAKVQDGFQWLAARDLRLNKRVNPAVGEVCLVQYEGGFISLKTSSDGLGTQVVVLSPQLDAQGVITKSHALVMDPAAANSSVSLVHADGHGVLLTKNGDAILKNSDGDAYVQANDTGLTFNGNIQVVGAMVVSPGTPPPQAVALAPAVQGLALGISLFAAATSVLAAAIPGVPGPALSTFQTAATALQNLVTALGGTFPTGFAATKLSTQ